MIIVISRTNAAPRTSGHSALRMRHSPAALRSTPPPSTSYSLGASLALAAAPGGARPRGERAPVAIAPGLCQRARLACAACGLRLPGHRAPGHQVPGPRRRPPRVLADPGSGSGSPTEDKPEGATPAPAAATPAPAAASPAAAPPPPGSAARGRHRPPPHRLQPPPPPPPAPPPQERRR